MKALTMKEMESDTMKEARINSKIMNAKKKALKIEVTKSNPLMDTATMNQLMNDIRKGELTNIEALAYFEQYKEDFLRRYEDACRTKIIFFNK